LYPEVQGKACRERSAGRQRKGSDVRNNGWSARSPLAKRKQGGAGQSG
jgi:hypothetical protein